MHNPESQIIRITKKYIIDYLNALCFENTVSWAGCDQYNELPIFYEEDEEGQKIEQRGALLVHKKYPQTLRMLVSTKEDTKQQVCYRVVAIANQINLTTPKKKVFPFANLVLDFSIADLNLGLEDVSSYSFADNINGDKGRIIKLLKYLLNCSVLVVDEKQLFSELLLDTLSFPPIAGDAHYKPIFAVESL